MWPTSEGTLGIAKIQHIFLLGYFLYIHAIQKTMSMNIRYRCVMISFSTLDGFIVMRNNPMSLRTSRVMLQLGYSRLLVSEHSVGLNKRSGTSMYYWQDWSHWTSNLTDLTSATHNKYHFINMVITRSHQTRHTHSIPGVLQSLATHCVL